jgi:metallo-beta-lactamase family protein
VEIDGFSSHADKNELMGWLSALKKPPRHVFVTHGDEEAAVYFAGLLREEKHWEATAPVYGEEFDLD